MNVVNQIKRAYLKSILRRNLPMSLVLPEYELPVEIKVITDVCVKRGKVPCTLNLDDLCPMHIDDFGVDFGGHPDEGVSLLFRNFLEDHPYIAVTIFVIPNSAISNVLSRQYHQEKNRYDISTVKNSHWLAFYKSIADIYNVEFGLHGYCHRQRENLLFNRHAEFAFKNEEESSKTIFAALEIFNSVGFLPCGFRQPAWDINSDMSLLPVLRKYAFKYIAGSSDDAGFNAGRERVSTCYPTYIGGLINFPQNILLDWSLDTIQSEIDKIVAMKGMISIKGHFSDSKIPNSLTPENIGKLRLVLNYLTDTYRDEIEYVTFRDIVEGLGCEKSCYRKVI